jgi:hypothetical protein
MIFALACVACVVLCQKNLLKKPARNFSYFEVNELYFHAKNTVVEDSDQRCDAEGGYLSLKWAPDCPLDGSHRQGLAG